MSSDTPDSASSLRAAALSTLKAKRKRPPPARIDPDAIQLNYGTDDADSHPAHLRRATSESAHREEGEISESETTNPSASTSANLYATPDNSNTPQYPTKKEPMSPVGLLFPDAGPSRPRRTTETSSYYGPLDKNHVRPGLSLNQDQYETSKETVLDLLGWGVDPEYLVTCGLSREIVYYVFSELNLRLPGNLDVSGLPPYPLPSDIIAHIRAGFTPASPPPNPETPIYPRPLLDESPPRPKPFLKSPKTSTLHDMEQQRRQELLARKAVLASRKRKPSDPSSRDEPIGSEPSAPPASVDDFLKTIGSAVNNGPAKTNDKPDSTPDIDAMDVDRPPSPQRSDPPSIRQGTSSTPRTPSSESLTQSESAIPIDSRRGTKRPVAADFVDSENGDGNGGYLPRNSRLQRKYNSFAGLSGMRRCVIDLSDSEGEGDEQASANNIPPFSNGTYKSEVRSHGGSRPRSSTPPTSIAAPAPMPAIPKSSAASRTMSPALLAEKETEIRKMKEMIAQRELNRQKKLANASRPATNANSPAPLTGADDVQQDELAGSNDESPTPATLLPTAGPLAFFSV